MAFTVDFGLMRVALTRPFPSEEFVRSLRETDRHHDFLRLCLEVQLNRRRRQSWSETRPLVKADETTRSLRRLLQHAYGVFTTLLAFVQPNLSIQLHVDGHSSQMYIPRILPGHPKAWTPRGGCSQTRRPTRSSDCGTS